ATPSCNLFAAASAFCSDSSDLVSPKLKSFRRFTESAISRPTSSVEPKLLSCSRRSRSPGSSLSFSSSKGPFVKARICNLRAKFTYSSSYERENQAPSKPCIFRVPTSLRNQKQSAYIPRVVSIGPFHDGTSSLAPMIGYKVMFMQNLFDRMGNEDVARQVRRDCAKAMLELVPTVRACYAECFPLGDVQFSTMMLVDGSFILELFYRSIVLQTKDEDDPIFGNELLALDVDRDLLLLENQVPFSVLQKLLDLTINRIEGPSDVRQHSLNELVLEYFGNMVNTRGKLTMNDCASDNYHILGLLRKCYLPRIAAKEVDSESGNEVNGSKSFCFSWSPCAPNTKGSRDSGDVKHPATELDSGVVKHPATELGSDVVKHPASELGSGVVKHPAAELDSDNYHILGLLRKCYLPRIAAKEVDPESGKEVDPNTESSRDSGVVKDSATELDSAVVRHSATELDRTGVTFVAGKGENLDVKFITSCWLPWLCGTCCIYDSGSSWFFRLFSRIYLFFGRTQLEIPRLCMYESTEPFLRNIIALEQCSPRVGLHFTSYAYLMDTLVNTKEDVELLESAGVLENNLGASEDASSLFNNLCKEVAMRNFLYLSQWKQVEEYFNLWWPRSLALLRRNYFSSPWAGIAVIAAFVLFLLTVVQTVYTIRSSDGT
ncbi:hypothetical protein RJ640_028508, partial [Escallonia rubra]